MNTLFPVAYYRKAMQGCLATLSIAVVFLVCSATDPLPALARTSALSTPTTTSSLDRKGASPCSTVLPTTGALSSDPDIECGRLGNGFSYLMMQNQHPPNRVSMHLYVRAGSLNETDAQRGIAHFLEHMQFNGSTHFPPGELVRYLQTIGMQFGNDANAHTGFDETVYDIVLPAGDEESLKQGLLVLQDYAMGALLLEEEIERESGVILAEMRARDSAAYRTFKATLQFELPHYLVSKRLPIGKADIIKKADRALLKHFYDTWYRPDTMVLVMVGDFEIPLARSLVESGFKTFRPRAPISAAPDLGTIDHQGLDVFYHHEPETGGTTVSIEVVRPYRQQPDSLALRRRELISELADGIVQNRLDTLQKQPETPFTAAAVGSGAYLNHIRYAEISADSSASNWRQTLSLLEQELRRAKLFGFSEAELARVKKETLNRLEKAAKEAPTRNSSQLARTMIRKLSENRVIQSPLQEMTTLAPILADLTVTDVHEGFLDSWPEDHRLVLVTGDADLEKSSTQPPAKQIRNAFLGSASTLVHPYEAAEKATFPYLHPPEEPGTIVSREIIADLGITCIRFANGVRLNLKPTDYKTNEVLANLVFGQGRSEEPPELPGLSLLTEATVNESGLGAMDTSVLERALAGTSTTVDFSVMEGYFNFAAASVSGEMELLFQLLYAHLADPAFRADAIRLARERLRQRYQTFSRSIEGMMRIEGSRILAGGDSRFGIPPLAALQAIGPDDIRSWIGPLLAAAPLELSIVGDFDENEVVGLARRYLGSLPERNGPPGSPRPDVPHVPAGTFHHIDVDTQISKALVVTAWPTEDFWDIHRTRRLSVLADVFSERLRDRIREKLGASYSPFAFNQASRAYPGYGTFQAHVKVAPASVGTVLEEIKTIAGNLARNGVTEDERMRAIDPILTAIKEYRQTNGYWLNSVMTGSGRAPQQFEWARSFIGDYGAITPQELTLLAATYLRSDRAATVVVRPEANK